LEGFSDLSESSHFHAQSERMLGTLRAFCVLQYSYWARTRGIGERHQHQTLVNRRLAYVAASQPARMGLILDSSVLVAHIPPESHPFRFALSRAVSPYPSLSLATPESTIGRAPSQRLLQPIGQLGSQEHPRVEYQQTCC